MFFSIYFSSFDLTRTIARPSLKAWVIWHDFEDFFKIKKNSFNRSAVVQIPMLQYAK